MTDSEYINMLEEDPDSIILIQQFFYDKTVKETAKFLSMTAAAVLSSIRKEKNNIHVSPEQTSALTTASSETSYETSEPAPKTSQTTVSEVSETSTDTAATRTVTSVYAVSGTAAETVPVEVTEIQPAEITEINQEPEKNYQEYFDYLHEFFTDEYICQYYTDDYNPFIEYDGKTFYKAPHKGTTFTGLDNESFTVCDIIPDKSFTIEATDKYYEDKSKIYYIKTENGWRINDIRSTIY